MSQSWWEADKAADETNDNWWASDAPATEDTKATEDRGFTPTPAQLRAAPARPFVGGDEPLVKPALTAAQLIEQPTAGAYRQSDLEQGSKSPSTVAQEQLRAQIDSSRRNAPELKAAPDAGGLPGILNKTVRKPMDGSLVGAAVETAGDAARGVSSAADNLAGSVWAGIQAGADAAGGDEFSRFAGLAGGSARRAAAQINNPADPNSLTKQVFESTFTSVPMMLGFQAAPLRAMMAQSAANEYGTSRDRGAAPEEATQRAVVMGLAEGIGEKFSLPAFQGLFAAAAAKASTKDLGRILSDLLVKEQIGEQVTTALQSGYEVAGQYGLKPNMTLAEYVDDAIQTAKVTFGQSLLTGGLAGGVKALARPQAPDALDLARSRGFLTGGAAPAATPATQTSFTPDNSPSKLAGLVDIVVPNASPAAVSPDVQVPDQQGDTYAGVSDALAALSAGRGPAVGGDGAGSLADPGRSPVDDGSVLPVPAAPPGRGVAPVSVAAAGGAQGEVQRPDGQAEAADDPADVPLTAPDQTWLGRKGSGFTTEADAQQSVPGRELRFPDLNHRVEADGTGRYAVNGYRKTPLDVAADAAATSPKNDLPQPTEAQKEAGNYRKGHITWGGLDISIENPKGSQRTGTDKDGKSWSTTMQHHYGYIKGTVGNDKDHVDAFIGDNQDSGKAFIVDQIDPSTGKFDEHKVILGAGSLEQAREIYRANYDKGWTGLGSITEMPLPQFRVWVKAGVKTRPVGKLGETNGAQRASGGGSDRVGSVESGVGLAAGTAPDRVGAVQPGPGNALPLQRESDQSTLPRGASEVRGEGAAGDAARGLERPQTAGVLRGAAAAGDGRGEPVDRKIAAIRTAKPAEAKKSAEQMAKLFAQRRIVAKLVNGPLTEEETIASGVAEIFGKTYDVIQETLVPADDGGIGGFINADKDGVYHVRGKVDGALFIVMHEVGHGLGDENVDRLITKLRPLMKDVEGFAQSHGYESSTPAKKVEELAMWLTQAVSKRPDFWRKVRDNLGDGDFKRLAKLILDKIQFLQKGFSEAYGDGFLRKHATSIAAVRDAVAEVYAEVSQEVAAQKAADGEQQYSQLPTDFTDPESRKEVSTTSPTAKASTNNGYDQKWVIDGSDIKGAKKHVETVIKAISQYNTLSSKGDASAKLKELHDVAVANLLWLHDLVPANIAARAKLWYDGANLIANDWVKTYGITDRQASGVLAVLSPQMDWFKNVSLGERVIHVWKNRQTEPWTPAMTAWVESWVSASSTVEEKTARKRTREDATRLEGQPLSELSDDDAAIYVRVFDETYHERRYNLVTPEGGFGDYVTKSDDGDSSVTWGGFSTISKAVSILRDGSFRTTDKMLGAEHKVRNFFNNIIAPKSADGHVTIDTHAVAAALLKALSGSAAEVMHNFGAAGGNNATGAGGTYGLFADAYRDAAAQRGLLPREMQSITWEAVRALFPAATKDQVAPQVDAIWDQFKAGKITRDEAREQVHKLAGGIRAMAWEGTDGGKRAADGGVSFNTEIDADPAKRAARTLPPKDAKEKLQISLAAATNSIPGIKTLYDLAQKGDIYAHKLLQDVALDSLRHLLAGTSAKIKADPATGLYGGATEPSLAVGLTFTDNDKAAVLAGLARFASNFNQEQVHARQGTDKKAGHQFDDGSYATPVYRWELKKALSSKEIQKIIDKSGLYGLTFGDDFVEAYYVGEPKDEQAIAAFEVAIGIANQSLGGSSASHKQSVARLWPYGRGSGAIGYDRIHGDVAAGPPQASATTKRVAEYLGRVGDVAPKVKAFEQADVTPEQAEKQAGIARVYESLPDNDLKNPRVRKAYTELAKEVKRQFAALPIKVEMFVGESEPYANSAAMRKDVLDNNHLFIYHTTPETYGPPGSDFTGHPLLEQGGESDVNGRPMLYNDLLRAVHDYYAHTLSATEFGPKGEEAAWKNHMAVTRSMPARWALTAETRGQNSWVNFRPGAAGVKIKDREFARQKAALLPVEYSLTGNPTVDKPMKLFIETMPVAHRGGSKPEKQAEMDFSNDPTESPAFKKWFGDSKIVDANGKPRVVYHGTAADFSRFDPKKLGSSTDHWTAEFGFFFTADPDVANTFAIMETGEETLTNEGANIIPAYLSIKNPYEMPAAEFMDLAGTSDGVEVRAIRKRLQADGHDGIWIPGDGESAFEELAADTWIAFKPTQIKSAIGNRGTFDPKNPAIDFSNNPKFKKWFGESKIVDANGKPAVWYHGTAQDITEFRPKQARAIFVADHPIVGEAYANASVQWMARNGQKRGAANILPLYVKAERPFDYENKDHVDRVVDLAFKQGETYVRPDGETALIDAETGARDSLYTKGVLREGLSVGSWALIESPAMQDAITALGHDSFFVREEGFKNLGVYGSNQLKSATGNNGEYDDSNPRIDFSFNLDSIKKPKAKSASAMRAKNSWFIGRDELGRGTFGPGAKAFDAVAKASRPLLLKMGLAPMSTDLKHAMRVFKNEVERSREQTADVAAEMTKMSPAERELISDIIEQELKAGVKPPEHIAKIAAQMAALMGQQTEDLIEAGMLSRESADKWKDRYLPRFYENKLIKKGADVWETAAKTFNSAPRALTGISGKSLKRRGMVEQIKADELPGYLAKGWAIDDKGFRPGIDKEVQVHRDYTRAERESMTEIRDSMFRFVMGYMRSQKDLALGRLYAHLSDTMASRNPVDGFVKVPDSKVEGTDVNTYGKLAGQYVPKEVLDHLKQFGESEHQALLDMYRKGLGMWKEGKTVLNPVSHVNNIVSNLSMAHFAGVSYWHVHKYIGAIRDFATNSDNLKEARAAGLFGGTISESELMNLLPKEMVMMAGKTQSPGGAAVQTVFNLLSLGLRKPLGALYQWEDLLFRHVIYADARARGLHPNDAVDWAQKFIFTYDDLPKTARVIRDTAVPFFSYTYKAAPVILETLLKYPHRFAGPAAALMLANTIGYAMAVGDDDGEDWEAVLKRLINDPNESKADAIGRWVLHGGKSEKARAKSDAERGLLPKWLKGRTALGTEKTIRLGVDSVTSLPMYWDVSRFIPGGDMLDMENNAGGIDWLPAPLTPSNPILSTIVAMMFNRDVFTGKDVVDSNDTSDEKATKRGEWMWRQVAPALAIGNYHFNRLGNAVAQATGETITWWPSDFTGFGKDGLPTQPELAVAQTFGVKIRPIDFDTSAKMIEGQKKKIIHEIESEMRSIRRLRNKGAVSESQAEAQLELARTKLERIREGLTVDGDEKK